MGLALLATAWLGLIFVVRAYRWRALLLPAVPVDLSSCFSATVIGFMGNNILPLRGGEILRIYALSRLGAVPPSTAIATGIFDRLFDVLAVTMLILICVPLAPVLKEYRIVAVVGLSVVVGVFGASLGLTYASRIGRWLWLPHRIRLAVDRISKDLQVFRDVRLLLKTIVSTLVIWLGMVVYFWILLWSYGLMLPVEVSLLLVVFLAVGVALPSAPGFVGVYHYAVVLALSLFAVEKGDAVAFSVVSHLLQYIPVTAVGLGLLIGSGISLWPQRPQENGY